MERAKRDGQHAKAEEFGTGIERDLNRLDTRAECIKSYLLGARNIIWKYMLYVICV